MTDLKATRNKDGEVVRSGTVTRRAMEVYDHRGRRIVVQLRVGDIIAMKEERTRRWFVAPINRVFRTLILWNVEAERIEKKKRRNRV